MNLKEAVRFCESIDCQCCPIFKHELDKRTKEEWENGVLCCENLTDYTIEDFIKMGDKVLTLEIKECYDENEDRPSRQDIKHYITRQHFRENLQNGYSISFHVHNLCSYPEDAIIGRDLFDADDFIDTLNLGIKLAKMGYDKVKGWYELND